VHKTSIKKRWQNNLPFYGNDGVIVGGSVWDQKNFEQFISPLEAESHRVPATADSNAIRLEHPVQAVLHSLIEPSVLCVLRSTLSAYLLVYLCDLPWAVWRIEENSIGHNECVLYKVLGKFMELCGGIRVEVIRHRPALAITGEWVNYGVAASQPFIKQARHWRKAIGFGIRHRKLTIEVWHLWPPWPPASSAGSQVYNSLKMKIFDFEIILNINQKFNIVP
jgi:hypothetical protein